MKSALSPRLSALSDGDQLVQQSPILADIVVMFLGTFAGRFY